MIVTEVWGVFLPLCGLWWTPGGHLWPRVGGWRHPAWCRSAWHLKTKQQIAESRKEEDLKAAQRWQALWSPTQIKVVGVQHEFRQIEELWNQLLDVGHVVFGGREPRFPDAVEHPVSQVKVTPLIVTKTWLNPWFPTTAPFKSLCISTL